ncbi:hypothetical protein [Thermoactinospora rubra]|uniref:hypothetical protein n=1 Tax=Thermoactinospora rubra TaxID=1088767 RepID=UPI00117C89F1|nr:hypothetical protein [Thermoactinospora rubra]
MSLLVRARILTELIPQAVACRLTAAHVWGLKALPWHVDERDWPVDLVVPEPVDVPGCATFVDSLDPDDVTVRRDVRVTTIERTALDCVRWLPRPDAVAVLDQFLRRGLDIDTLIREVGSSWRLRDTLMMADPGAGSPRESWLRVVLVEGWLPRPSTQIRVPLGEGRVAYLDMGWEEFKVGVEYDGVEHHSSPTARLHDDRRREEIRAKGWRVIAVRRDARPADIVEHVANALIERGWRPGPERTRRILGYIRARRRRRRR